MGEFPSTSLLGSVNLVSQDRDGVRIDAPHGWEIHDVHHQWNKNKTLHIETGMVFHVTSGQVFHSNLNTAEVHGTANALTMHVDFTPLNVHIALKPLAFDVHIARSGKHGHWNVGGGGHHTLVGEIHQEAQDVRITSTQRELGFADKRANVSKAPAQKGNMPLEAERVLTIKASTSIGLEARVNPDNNNYASLSLNQDGNSTLRSTVRSLVHSDTATGVVGGNSQIQLENDRLVLTSAAASVRLSGGNLTMQGNNTVFRGRVRIGDPAIEGMAEQAAVDIINRRIDNDLVTKAQIKALTEQIQQVLDNLPKG